MSRVVSVLQPTSSRTRSGCYLGASLRCSRVTTFSRCSYNGLGHRTPIRTGRTHIFPTLLLNLSPEAPGGTWIEDPRGHEPARCSDGKTRRGTTLRGAAYRFSARSHWHGAAAMPQERLVLLAWVPAGWTCLGNLEISRLCRLGFRLPDRASEERCRMSEWSARTTIQRSLEEVVQVEKRWGAGALRHQVNGCSALHVCMSSDEEVQPPGGDLNCELTPRATICLDSDRDEDASQNSDVVQCVESEFKN